MTEDTKRALEILSPICKELRIDLRADENRLYMNGQAIGIAYNSTYATTMEGLGYVFQKEYPRFRMSARIDKRLKEDIRRYWISDGDKNE